MQYIVVFILSAIAPNYYLNDKNLLMDCSMCTKTLLKEIIE